MKRLTKIIVPFVMLFALFFVVSIEGNAKPSKYFDATYYTNNIPTGYYNDVDTSLTDDAFRRNLSTIISRGYVKHSYTTNNEVLTYTDPDPSGNGKIICLYTGQSLSSGSWNKEHVWAKSHGFPSSSAEPYCDAHHLRPTLNSINSSRSNSDFGELDGVSGAKSDSYGNRWTSGIFEPRDEVKGDVARMMFYMATRYGYTSPYNLKLVDDSSTSLSDGNGRFGNLQTLLKWHYQDPVSKEEIYRNNIIYEFYQKNRNPYIDHPEYVDYAYPNNYSSSLEVDEAKVNNVISLIGSLPTVVTLDHKQQITAAQTAYNALNSLEKQKIVNYAELERCLSALRDLEGSSTTTPDVPTTQGDIEIDFETASGVSNSYKADVTFTASGKDFFASYAYCGGPKDLRLGYNKSDHPLDSKLGISGNGAYLEPQFDVENLKSMKLSITGKYGTISSWYVLFKASGASTYTQVASGNPGNESSYDITASLSSLSNGRFVVVVVGSLPRVIISKLSLYTGTGGQPSIPGDSLLSSFAAEQTVSSLKLDFDASTGEVLSADLRFGAKIKSSSYNSDAKYGVIVYDGEYADLFEAGEQGNETSASHFVGDEYFVEISPVRVNQYGEEDANGAYYRFSWVINNMEGHYSDTLVAVIYMEYNGKLYLGKQVVGSLSSVAKEYIDQNVFTDPITNQAIQSLYQ